MKKHLSSLGIIFLSVCLLAGCGPRQPKELVYLTLEELKNYDGQDGKPTYVAVNGDIYDISRCWYWKKGKHLKVDKKVMAGRDLTAVLNNESKHGLKELIRYPIVGRIVSAKE